MKVKIERKSGGLSGQGYGGGNRAEGEVWGAGTKRAGMQGAGTKRGGGRGAGTERGGVRGAGTERGGVWGSGTERGGVREVGTELGCNGGGRGRAGNGGEPSLSMMAVRQWRTRDGGRRGTELECDGGDGRVPPPAVFGRTGLPGTTNEAYEGKNFHSTGVLCQYRQGI